MKKTYIEYIKLTLALLLFLQVGKLSAQTSCTISGVTITVSGSQSGQSALSPSLNSSGCPSSTFTGLGYGNGNGTSGFITYTFSAPVTSAKVYYSAVNSIVGGSGSVDDGTITISNGQTPILSNACGVSISGNRIIGNNTNGQLADANVTVTSSTPFTWIKIVNTVNSTGYLQGNLCDFTVVPLCKAGTTSPTLSSNTITNPCPTATFSLNSLVTSTLPTGASLKWYTDAAHTTEVTTPTAVSSSGTYYAFYVDTVNNCYSPASAAVTATVTLCPLNITNTCPSNSVDLALSLASSNVVPSGYTLTYHSGTPATTANKLTSSVVTTSGTYYGAYFHPGVDCYTATSRPLVVTITNCCATIAPPTFN